MYSPHRSLKHPYGAWRMSPYKIKYFMKDFLPFIWSTSNSCDYVRSWKWSALRGDQLTKSRSHFFIDSIGLLYSQSVWMKDSFIAFSRSLLTLTIWSYRPPWGVWVWLHLKAWAESHHGCLWYTLWVSLQQNSPFETEKFGLQNRKLGLYLILETEQRPKSVGLQ